MRKLMWFAIGFATACLIAFGLLWDSGMKSALILSLLASICLFVIGKRNMLLYRLLISLLGATAAFTYILVFRNVYIIPLSAYDGETLPLCITASSYTEPSRYSNSFDGYVQLNDRKYKIRVYLGDDEVEVHPGDVLETECRIRLTAPGGMKESIYYQGNGILLLGSQKGEYHIERAASITLRTLPAILAREIRNTLNACFPEDTAPFASALLLGDSDSLSYETDTALKISGIRHVTAASGLHISILYGLIVAIFRRNRFITPFIAIITMSFFAAIAGFTPSVTRACIMMSLIALEGTFDREYDGLTALSFACLIMLLINPFIVNSVSFQLSAASVAGIYLFNSKVSEWIKGHLPKYKTYTIIGRFLDFELTSASISLSTLITTAPLCVYYFHTFSLFSVITNLLTLFVISGVFSGIAAVCLLGELLPGAGKWLAEIVSFPIRYVLWVARKIASLPIAAVYASSRWIIYWLILCYILGLLTFARRGKHLRRNVVLGMASLVLAISISWIQPRLDNSRINVIYVGEGQSILLQSKGHSFLVDCGGNTDSGAADAIAENLLGQGVFRLDGIALTHYDRDHAGALQNLLTRIKVDKIYLPDMEDHGFRNRLVESGVHHINDIVEDTFIPLGSANLTLFTSDHLKTENENCMCILFEGENCVILITGDRSRSGEKRLIKQHDLPDVDILIAGHHGSKNSTSQELLDAVSPEMVIISAGRGNSYGHPAQELLDRLEENKCEILRTDLEGTICIRR